MGKEHDRDDQDRDDQDVTRDGSAPDAATPRAEAGDQPVGDRPVEGSADAGEDGGRPDTGEDGAADGAAPVPDDDDPDRDDTSPAESPDRDGAPEDAEGTDERSDGSPGDEPPGDEPPSTPGQGGRARRLLWVARRPTAAGTVIGVLLGLLGFALVVQLRSNGGDQLASTRPEDLVRILSDLDSRKDRLSQEISNLQSTEQQLAAGSQSRQAALAEATRRADELGILAGTLAAKGPGIVVRFLAAGKPIRASDVLDAVEELRGSGAEAMQIDGANGVSVRIVASTSFVDGSGGLVVDGQVLTSPYVITAIGDPPTMQTALNIPGGVVDTVQTNGGNVIVEQPGTVTVSTLRQPAQPRYAHPVS